MTTKNSRKAQPEPPAPTPDISQDPVPAATTPTDPTPPDPPDETTPDTTPDTVPDGPRWTLVRPKDYHDKLDLMARFYTLFGVNALAWAGDDMMMTEEQAKRLLGHEWPTTEK